MGEVYEAEHVRVGKRVALKCLSRSLMSNAELVERFAREAKAASAAVSPHVVEMLDVGTTEDDGTPFLVMELLDGAPLSRAIAEGPLSIARALRIGREIAEGLDAAHRAGVIHRDLKPDNVFLVKAAQGRETVKILDFGISKVSAKDTSQELTRTGSALGTPTHMAPEQIEATQEIDARADLWALGVLLFQMLTGQLPFDAESYGLLLVRIMGAPPASLAEARPDVPEALVPIVLRCLAKSRDDRYATARAVERALGAVRLEPSAAPSSETPLGSFTADREPGAASPRTPAPRTPAPMTPAPKTPAPMTPAPMTPAPKTPAPMSTAPMSTAAITPELRRTPSAGRAREPSELLPGELRLPRDSYTLDLESVLRTVPSGSSVKGLFLESVVERVPDRVALFAKAGVAPRRIVPFLDFPYDEYMRILVAAAETVFPTLPRTLALRRFHHSFYEEFADTLAGRVMFGVLGTDAERILPIGARGWQVNVKLGSVTAQTLGPKHVRYVFAKYPALICECCDVGVIEGAMRFLGEPQARVRIHTPTLDHTEVDIAW